MSGNLVFDVENLRGHSVGSAAEAFIAWAKASRAPARPVGESSPSYYSERPSRAQ